MRKINSILVMLLLVLSSMQIVFADSHEDGLEDGSEVEYEEEIKDGEVRTREKIRTADGRRIETRSRVKGDRVEARKRVRVKSRKEAMDRVKEARDRFREHKEKHRERKDEFLEARDRFRAVCGDEETDECKEIKGQALERAKAFLLNAAEVFIKHIDNLIARVEESDIADERKDNVIGELNACIDEVRAAMVEIEASATIPELRENVKNLRDVMKRCRSTLIDHKKTVKHKKVGRILSHIKAMHKKLERVLNHVEKNEIDVDISGDVEEFKAKISEAEAAHNDGDDRGAHDLLKEADRLLKDIIKKVKDANVDLEEASEGDEEEEVEEEDEDEEEDEEEELE